MVKCNYEYPCIGCEKLTKESKVIAPSASNNNRSDEIALLEDVLSYMPTFWQNSHGDAVLHRLNERIAQLRAMR